MGGLELVMSSSPVEIGRGSESLSKFAGGLDGDISSRIGSEHHCIQGVQNNLKIYFVE